jgi:2-methylcitrate dehydratase PrpD
VAVRIRQFRPLWRYIQTTHFPLGQIESIEVSHHPDLYIVCDRSPPSTGLSAKFSIQYCTAVRLLNGAVRIDDLTDEAVSRPEVTIVRDRIRTHADPTLPEWTIELDIDFTEGSSTYERVTYAPADGESTLSTQTP